MSGVKYVGCSQELNPYGLGQRTYYRKLQSEIGEEGATDGYEGGHKGDEHGGNEDTKLEELKEEM